VHVPIEELGIAPDLDIRRRGLTDPGTLPVARRAELRATRPERRASRSRAAGRGARDGEAGMSQETTWHKDAIIYELHVKAFRDGNRDGYGDFQGLIEKLPYLEELGVTAIWLVAVLSIPAARRRLRHRALTASIPATGRFATCGGSSMKHTIAHRVITSWS